MSTSSLGRILDSGAKNQIELLYDDVSGLTDTVGTTAWTLKSLSVSAPKPDLSVFNVPLELSASATASAGVSAATATFTPFGSDTALTAPQGSSYANLTLTGTLGVGANAAAPSGVLQLSGTAAASSTFNFQHLLPVKSTDTHLSAMLALAKSAELPQWSAFQNLADGEVNQFTGSFSFDLGVKASAGRSFDLDKVVSLFDGLSGSIKASARYSLEAALGWSLYDEMTLAVGKTLTQNANWVRVRLDRTHSNSLTFNVTFGLQAEYDATDIVNVLEHALQLSPVVSLLDTIEEVLAILASGDWTTVQAKLSDAAADRLTTLVGPAWKTWVENSDDVTKFVAFANEVVSYYNGLDAKVQSLWTDILTKVGIGPDSQFQTAVAKIAAIDPSTFTLKDLLSSEWQQRLDMLEAFTGLSLEDLVLGNDSTARRALTRAVKIATQVENILTNTPSDITSAIDKMATSHGITQAVDWLAKNATSKAALEDAGLGWLRKLVSDLVGKAWDKIDDADLAKVQALAKNLQTKVLAVQDTLNAAMKKAVDLAKGDIGFSLALEMSRVSESSALLDFEFDPTNDAARSRVADKLPGGSIQALLGALDDLSDDNPVPYLIRECVITSSRVRTGGWTAMLSLFGLQKTQSMKGTRTEESRIEITNSGRSADYSGGFVQTIQSGDAVASECGVWLESTASATSLSTSAPYESAEHTLSLTFSRTDSATTARELGAFDRMLEELGFLAVGATPRPSTLVPANAQTIFSLQLKLDQGAIQALVADLGVDGMDVDFRNAAHRNFVDGTVSSSLVRPKAERGDAIAEVILSPQFASTWRDDSTNAFKEVERTNPITYEDTVLDIVVGDDFQAAYTPVRLLIQRRPKGINALGEFAQSFTAAATPTPDSLRKLARETADAFASTSGRDWDNPAFNLWLVLARLSRLNTASLTRAQGLAQIKWKTADATDYGNPTIWQLSAGVPTDLTAGRAFPISAPA